jgi:hypothetical protein
VNEAVIGVCQSRRRRLRSWSNLVTIKSVKKRRKDENPEIRQTWTGVVVFKNPSTVLAESSQGEGKSMAT